jgi:hypothetical protein
VSCRLTGRRRNRATCTVRHARSVHGKLRLRVTRGGRVVAAGEAVARGRASTAVRLRGAVRAGRRYTLTTTLPAGPRTRTKITQRLVLR